MTYLKFQELIQGQWGHTRLVVGAESDDDGRKYSKDFLNYLCGQREDRRGRRERMRGRRHRVVWYASGYPIRRETVGVGREQEREGFVER